MPESVDSMRYFANPAHKRETTEAGPPRWRSDKEPCSEGMTLRERTELLRESVAESPIHRRLPVLRFDVVNQHWSSSRLE